MIPAGFGVFLLANLLYTKWRLEDEPEPIRRAAAFCLGLPTTFLVFLLVESDHEMAWKRQLRREARDDDVARIEEDLARELAHMRRFRTRSRSAEDGANGATRR